MVKRVLSVSVILAAAIAMSGCFLILTLGIEEATTLSQEIDLIVDAIRTSATTAVCQKDPFFTDGFRKCTYFINGVQVGSTTTLVSELGVTGVFLDPIVLELPAGATGIHGTYTGGGSTGDLLVYPNLSFVPTDDTHTLQPGPGRQLAVFDLPAGVAVDHVDYQFDVGFQTLVPTGSGPTQFKALATGKVQVGGKTFYPPMLPCVSDFALVPSVTMPRPGPAPINLPSGLTGCNNQRYFYFFSESRPMPCDLDNDHDVDRNDVALIMAVRNRAAAAGDPRDINADGFINANDARACTLQCTRAQCNP